VQDAYSLRCAPQVHGASRDLLDYADYTVSIELNAATDNPLVLVDDESLVSENKVLAHPASVDSIPTSAGQEDHVSMGNTSGLKAWQVLANVESALAIELLAGAQGVEFHAPLEPGAGVRAARAAVRELSPRLREDRPLSSDIEAVALAIRDGSLIAAVEAEVGELA
jgi:histidine ammonia-lyase